MHERRADNALDVARLMGNRVTVLAEMEAMESRIDAGFAQLHEDIAKRDKDNLRWQIGLWVATVVILGIIVRWPA